MLIYLSMIETEEDKSKFVLLYEKYRKLMYYVANQILKDEYLSEDAVHQTFIKIIENLDNISEIDCHKTKSYIVTMVRNHSINLYNQRKNHPMVSLDTEMDIESNEIFEIQEEDAIVKAVANLPQIYNAVLTLKYVQEFSNTEIAEALDISESTVRKRLERAKSKVQESLEKEENGSVR